MPDDRPNVLFVFSDQHRAMDLGCAGNPDVQTPTLDRLADEGRRYENAVATVPLCGPNRACLLTGQYPLTHRSVANDVPLPTDAPSVAEAFREAGYRTGYIGKWHLDGVPRDKFTPPGPRRQGFDDFWAAFNCSHDYMDAGYYRDDDELIEIEGYEPETQTDLAIDFVRGEVGVDGPDDDRPFCLFLSYGPPHSPYGAVPEEYRDLYDPEEIAVRPNAEPIPPSGSDYPGVAEMDPRELLADYYAQITALDDQVGRLVDCLEESGLADDTAVAYTSDHGDMLFSHGRLKKEQPHAESVDVPLVARWPGEIPAGTVDDTLFGTVDVAPTLLSLAGVTPPEAMEGTDLSRSLLGAGMGDDEPDSAFVLNPCPADQATLQGLPAWRGVKTKRHTYARMKTPDGDRPWVLFDDEADPYQVWNLVLGADARDVRERLDGVLDAWLERTGDDFADRDTILRDLGLVDLWNEREREMHPEAPELL